MPDARCWTPGPETFRFRVRSETPFLHRSHNINGWNEVADMPHRSRSRRRHRVEGIEYEDDDEDDDDSLNPLPVRGTLDLSGTRERRATETRT